MNYSYYLIIFALYVIQVQPIGWMMKKLTQRWRDEVEIPGAERNSLASAGLWIGVLERLLIVTFVLLHQYSAIGFLMGAKSLLRFGDSTAVHPRKQSEYILIGTLLSVCFALFTTIMVSKLLDYYILQTF